MECAFFRLDLLKAETVPVLIKVIQARPIPLLVLLGILLLEAADILSQLLQVFFFKLAFRLARSILEVVLAELELLGWRGSYFDFSSLGGIRGRYCRVDVATSFGRVCQCPLRRWEGGHRHCAGNCIG